MRTILTLGILLSSLNIAFAQTEAAPAAEQQAPAVAAPVAVEPVAAAPVAAAPVVTAEKRTLIMKFVEVFGTKKALEQNFEMMLEQMPSDKPEEAAKLRERVKVDEILELLIPVYDRNFSAEELQAFISFYESPNGQKLINTIPVLMQESVEVSANYLEEKFPEFSEDAGFDNAPLLDEEVQADETK